CAEHAEVAVEVVAQRSDVTDGLLEAGGIALHAELVPDDLAGLAVEVIRGARAVDAEELARLVLHELARCSEGLAVGGRSGLAEEACEVVADGGREDEVAVPEALHEGGRAETVGAV